MRLRLSVLIIAVLAPLSTLSVLSFYFGRGSAVWNNNGDCGYLYDQQGTEVSSYCY